MRGGWVPIAAAIPESKGKGLPAEEIAVRMDLPVDTVCWVLERL